MNLVIMGPKGAGKSSVGAALAERLGLEVFDTDARIALLDGKGRTCREIFVQEGEAAFRALEREAALAAAREDYRVVVTGGGLMMAPEARRALRPGAVLIYLTAPDEVLYARALANGTPPWMTGPDGKEKFLAQVAHRDEVLRPFADIVLDTSNAEPEALAEDLANQVAQELAIRQQSGSTFGEIIRVTSFGESHGRAIGVVLEGVRPGVELSEADIQEQMDRRRPGQSKVVTQRKEPDSVEILSGVFEGQTTGAPIALVIHNQDQRSKSYDNIKDVFRPGHGDFTFYQKYGRRDYRGGGRQSGRETATRVAAGAVAWKLLRERGVCIVAHAVEVAGIVAQRKELETIERNPVRCADPDAAREMEAAILQARSERDSVGGVVQLEIEGLPPGLGDPIFGKLDARLCQAIMSIGAMKGVEIGSGFAVSRMRGSEANDAMHDGQFLSNHHGGILGGISSGAPLLMRVAVKPTASIAQTQHTTNEHGENVDIEVLGRHDPCIVPRAVPVIENMAALVIADAWCVQARLNPEWADRYGTC